MLKFTTRSAAETHALGQALGKLLRGGEIIALSGPLGSGKTVFAKGLARGAGIKEKISSPTFAILRPYPRARGVFYHLDLYRVKSARELGELGFPEMLQNRDIAAVEWPERAGALLPPKTMRLVFSLGTSRNERSIKIL